PSMQKEEEQEEDPREELVRQLLEYKMYKCMSYELKDRQIDAGRVIYKEPTIPKEVLAYKQPINMEELLADVTLAKLNEIFKSVMQRQVNKIDPVRSKFGEIQKEEISVEDKMTSLEQYATKHKKFSFRGLLEKQCSKVEVIVTFLAILELMKIGKIAILQENLFDDIQICSNIAG
ncbi:MAG: segregation/condensation protein A, partial [Lachnospiraceae bacterium]|nr:segregation/condensation protein A [Lachnospiraceae bacterium]